MLATKQRKRGASVDGDEGPAVKRERPSDGGSDGGGLSLAALLRSKAQNSGSDTDNAPLKLPKAARSRSKSKSDAAKSKKKEEVKAAGKEVGGEAEAVFELSAKRRVTVRKWRTAVLVDLREFYDDHGTAKPGKKGISLSLDQWKPLARRLRDISAAVEIVEEDRVGDKSTVVNMTDCLIGAEAGDERSIAFSLSPKRRVTVRYFHNSVLVDIREFYDQDGVSKPGRKGISLSKAQWIALQELAFDISDAANRL